MSGSITGVVQGAGLAARASATGTKVLGIDLSNGDFCAVDPNALRGLTGPAGAQGIAGAQGPQGQAGTAGLTGPQGAQGIQGIAGAAGAAGRSVLSGTAAPTTATGANGDFFINTTSWVIYGAKAGGVWPAAVSIIGPQGPQGPAGTGGGAGNVQAGVTAGDAALWDPTDARYEPTPTGQIVDDHTPTIQVASGLAVTAALHNRRNLRLTALAPLTMSTTDIGGLAVPGIEFVINNDHVAVNTLTFGVAPGFVVKQPLSGTGTGQQIKVAIDGEVTVFCYPNGAGTGYVCKVRGDVA